MFDATIIDNDTPLISYPKLMESLNGDLIVLFESERRGVVLYTKTILYSFGEILLLFPMSNFKPFLGKITLSNMPESGD